MWFRLALLGVVLALLGVAYVTGIFARFADPAGLARSIADLGALGYLVFVVAYAILQPFGVPGTVFIVAAPLVWPWPVAFALSMVGTMAASVIGFSFYRFVGRDWVEGLIPARWQKYDQALAERGFATVFVLRFIFWMPPMLHAFFGVSKVRFWAHFWGSLAGYVVPLLVVSYFGGRVMSALAALPATTWIAVAAVVAVAAGAFLFGRRVLRTRQRPSAPG